jgi:hypothetical protein
MLMKKMSLLVAALLLAACSRNSDPEYAPEAGDAVPGDAPVETTAPAPAASEPAPAAADRLSDEEAYRLGREAAAFLFANDMASLFERFDANVKAQAGSAENFGQMVGQVFAQTGVEGSMVEEAIESDPANPALAIYRRRGTYLAIGSDLNLLVALNADGTIAGVNLQPAQ